MGYLVCKNCGYYYELQPGETANDPQNLRFWDPENKVFEGFDKCQCGEKLIYRKHLNSGIDDFKDLPPEKSLKTKSPINSKMIKPLGLGILFIFGLLIKFHAFNFIIPYLARSNSNFLFSSPVYIVLLIVLGFFLSYLGRYVR